jgi:hypothetical protein
MVPELDPLWLIAYWVVMGAAVFVSIWAAVVLISDYVQSRHADLAPPDAMRVARSRLDSATHQRAPLAPLPRLRPRDAGLADPLTFEKRRVN